MREREREGEGKGVMVHYMSTDKGSISFCTVDPVCLITSKYQMYLR